MVVANCKSCNRVFKMINGPECPECRTKSLNKLSDIYNYVQSNPDLSLEELSAECDIPFKDLEKILMDGKLGTAASKVTCQCQRCGISMPALRRQGHFCMNCAKKVEIEARIDPVSMEKKAQEALENGLVEPGKEAAAAAFVNAASRRAGMPPSRNNRPGFRSVYVEGGGKSAEEPVASASSPEPAAGHQPAGVPAAGESAPEDTSHGFKRLSS